MLLKSNNTVSLLTFTLDRIYKHRLRMHLGLLKLTFDFKSVNPCNITGLDIFEQLWIVDLIQQLRSNLYSAQFLLRIEQFRSKSRTLVVFKVILETLIQVVNPRHHLITSQKQRLTFLKQSCTLFYFVLTLILCFIFQTNN